MNEADAVADVKAAVAAAAKAAAAPQQSMRPANTPVALGLPPPPGAPPTTGGDGLPPDWQEASGPTGVYYYNVRTKETTWTRPAGGPAPQPAVQPAAQTRAPAVPKKLGLTARLGWR
uniref:WW domain-containing protein n=1 Tax=Haptolina brevifila TaxID=156173 RepID=A0A7S2CYF3_9EUKA|mmetsp:Transcript_30630/g.61509  ORF Transcript_30630/g.61509 Transcript_30630/m.61509 type:complete len:117 (+) Transcript_30630:1-351(+)